MKYSVLSRCAALFCLTGGAALSEGGTPEAPLRFSVEHMDRKVDPGTDFYRYACGQWLKNAKIPADAVSWSPTEFLVRRNAELLRDILEEMRSATGERSVIGRLVGDFYASALDTGVIESKGVDPIQGDLAKIEALSTMEGLAELLADFHSRGISGLFDFGVWEDQRKSDVYAVQLTQGGLNLPERDYYLEPRFAKELREYRKHLRVMLELSGRSSVDAVADAKVILAIESALASCSRSLEALGDPVANYHKMGRAELSALVPSFPWEVYWGATKVGAFESAIVGQPEFFKGLEVQLKRRGIGEWKVYLRWCLVHSSASLLHKKMEDANFAFYGSVLQGQPEMNPRWKRALRQVDRCLGDALGQLYSERWFSQETHNRAKQMVENLSTAYREELQKVPWMSPETRLQAVAKFDRFQAKIGFPERPQDYSKIEIRADDYFGNVERATLHEWQRQMARVGQPVDKSEWEMTAPTVNAYFKPTRNEIVFPAGILQPPFFDPTMDDAVNYGSTGATIGHEMTHGYDNEGRKYDADGNLRDWWKAADAKAFDRRSRVLVDQFNRFTPLPKLHVNGRLTLAENIADLGGLRIAYLALQKALAADLGKRQVIDGFTPEQRFFISYAQSWAAINRPESIRSQITTDSHAPDMFRGYAPLLHLQEFYDAFGIKSNSKLYLPKKERASIW
ncbi:MAG: M13 family metallopeptidase [Verrucomicrobiota bacterium]